MGKGELDGEGEWGRRRGSPRLAFACLNCVLIALLSTV